MEENQHIEFKLNWKEDFLKNVCAFANSEGGILYIGISDNGEVVGVEDTTKLLETLPNIINQKTGIIPFLEIEHINEKQIVKIIVQASSVPISYNGRYYLRSGSVVLELLGRELSDFLLRKSGITWDAIETYTQWDFEPDIATFELFKKLSYDRLPFAKDENDVQVLLKKLNLLTSSLLPTKAAILLFDKNPQRFFPQAVIKIGRFINEADIVSSDIVEGNLFQQAETTLAILKTKYLLSGITYEGAHRRERLEYPYEALREAVFNALIHRDYNTTSTIQIKIYNNSLSIANEGKLPPEITIDDLKREHLSKPRNKLLADIFYKAGFIESWGRGTLKIILECKKAHIPEPNFYEEHGVVKIIFRLSIGGNDTIQGEEISGEISGEINEEINGEINAVLILIKNNGGIKANNIAKGVMKPKKTIDRYLKKLKDIGRIEYRGSNKTGGYYAI
jgi:ATP-dependent DNA helicase RecG